MSGHSKWSQIKRSKGLKDQKKGQTFTKLANAITIAVKQGGAVADPEQNFRLRLAIDAARTANMPKENIDRAIKRAIEQTMNQGAEGIKITCAGRLGGAEMSRTETYKQGKIPLATLRADIDYGFGLAKPGQV